MFIHHVPWCLSMFVHVCPCLSMFVHVCPCLSMFVHVYPLCITIYPWLSVISVKGVAELMCPASPGRWPMPKSSLCQIRLRGVDASEVSAVKVVRNGQKWSEMVRNGQKWSEMVRNGQNTGPQWCWGHGKSPGSILMSLMRSNRQKAGTCLEPSGTS